jgi:predicted O-linked N-acetylglucosamine transferase (SPINDLY family)
MPHSPPAALDPDVEIDAARDEMRAGRAASAVHRLRALIDKAAFDPVHHYWLAAALGAAGDWDSHRATLAQAQAFHALKVIQAGGADLLRFQDDPGFATEIGRSFDDRGMIGVASVGYGRGALAPDAPLATTLCYGLSLLHQGRLEEAVAAFQFVRQCNPGSVAAHTLLLHALSFAEDGGRWRAEEAQRWRSTFGQVQKLLARPFPGASLDGRPLNVGYVLPQLDADARHFLAPVLEHHDRDRVRAVLYVQAWDEAVPAPAEAMRVIGEMDDASAAALIRSDGIDVLVDLCGHAPGGRLAVFVRRAAPVQVSWTADGLATGAPEIDYLLWSDGMEESEAGGLYPEAVWAIGPVQRPFRPNVRASATPTPARAQGSVSFGALGDPARINDRTLDAWARILSRVPGSGLSLRPQGFADEVMQGAVLMRFAARGVDPNRLSFRDFAPQDIDLALDPSPISDHEALLRTLAGGAPSLTLAGQIPASRVGAAAVGALGLEGLVARSWDGYVDRAVELASDVEALDALRRRIPAAFDRSALTDEEGFTRRLEGAFTDMFNRWRAGESRLTTAA